MDSEPDGSVGSESEGVVDSEGEVESCVPEGNVEESFAPVVPAKLSGLRRKRTIPTKSRKSTPTVTISNMARPSLR